MAHPNTKISLDELRFSFDVFPLSGPDWPVVVMAAVADSRVKARWPAFPHAATVDSERLGHGRGWTVDQARLGAIGELVEIASCCDWGDLEVEMHAPRDLTKAAWGPEVLSGFSKAQRANRHAWNIRLANLDWIAPETDQNRKIRWVAAQDAFDDSIILVPAEAVILGSNEANGQSLVSPADTNGCAAGATFAQAQLAAVYELIERDALSRWWYCGQSGALLPTESHKTAIEFARFLETTGRTLHLRDITSDLNIPTCAAVVSDPDGGCLSAGFATRYDPSEALECALMELMQMELKQVMIRSGQLAVPEFETKSETISIADLPPSSAHGSNPKPLPAVTSQLSVPKALKFCLDRLKHADCRLAFIDCSRPEFGIPVVRAISPDLCHWKPRFGRSRMNVGMPAFDRKIWRH